MTGRFREIPNAGLARDSPKRRKQKYRPRPLAYAGKCKIVGLLLNHEEPEPERKVRSPENDERAAFGISGKPSRLLGDAEWETLKARRSGRATLA